MSRHAGVGVLPWGVLQRRFAHVGRLHHALSHAEEAILRAAGKRAHRQPLKGLMNAIRRHAFFKVHLSTHSCGMRICGGGGAMDRVRMNYIVV